MLKPNVNYALVSPVFPIRLCSSCFFFFLLFLCGFVFRYELMELVRDVLSKTFFYGCLFFILRSLFRFPYVILEEKASLFFVFLFSRSHTTTCRVFPRPYNIYRLSQLRLFFTCSAVLIIKKNEEKKILGYCCCVDVNDWRTNPSSDKIGAVSLKSSIIS